MKTTLPIRAIVLLGSVTLALVSAACGSSSSSSSNGGGGSSIITSSSTTTTSSSSSSSSSSGTGGTGGTGTTTTTTSSSSSGCFSGTPTTNEEFLNACVPGMTCQALTTTLPLLEADGGLPALP